MRAGRAAACAVGARGVRVHELEGHPRLPFGDEPDSLRRGLAGVTAAP